MHNHSPMHSWNHIVQDMGFRAWQYAHRHVLARTQFRPWRHMLRSAGAVVLTAAMLVGVASCGTVDDSSMKAYDVTHIQKVDSIAALLPSSVTRDGKLVVGMDTSYAPAEFLAGDGHTPIGYDVDIARALAQVFGLEAAPTTASFDAIIPSVGTRYDIGISSFTITPVRMKAVDFVSLYKAGETFVVRKGNPEQVQFGQLCGRKVAVQNGTMEESELLDMAQQCRAEGKDRMEVQSFPLQSTATTSVITGKADLFYADSPVAGYAIAQTGDALERLGKAQSVAEQGIVVAKGDTQTAQALQQAMQYLIDSGEYMKILQFWGAQDGAITQSAINPKVK